MKIKNDKNYYVKRKNLSSVNKNITFEEKLFLNLITIIPNKIEAENIDKAFYSSFEPRKEEKTK